MARHLHFDCFNGISGDMTLGALIDLGVAIEDLQDGLKGLPFPFALRAERIKRQGIMGTLVHVEVEEERHHHHDHGGHGHPHSHSHSHPHAHLRDIVKQVTSAGLPDRVTRRAITAYEMIADAEAAVHGSTREKIHFHEVGARDAVLDVAGAMLGVELLGIESFSCSVIATGWGTVKCDHGIMPVPAPATAEILRDLPTTSASIEGELTTPTGAAILKTLVGPNPGPAPGMKVERIGYGAGTRRIEGHPNYLRLAAGEAAATGGSLPLERQEITILETEIDDMTPEAAGYVLTRLLEAGALDAQLQPVQMKKNRPGIQLRALARSSEAAALAEIILRETSTFGLRVTRTERLCLGRVIETVETELGPVRVKFGLWGDEVLKASPEFESCRALAETTGRPLAEIYEMARRAAL